MKTDKGLPRRQLVEVWGDTADVTHLAWSIVLGIGISLPAFLLASRLLRSVVSSPDLARAYAMLAGLGGCVLAGVVCAILFKPKRVVVEGAEVDPFWRQEVLTKLHEQTGDLGRVADLPASVVQEMKELQIYDLFVDYENAARLASNAAALPAHTTSLQQPGAVTAPLKEA
jgi:hypothetical protein